MAATPPATAPSTTNPPTPTTTTTKTPTISPIKKTVKKSSPTKKSTTTSSTQPTEKQLKLQKAEIAKRELKELESIERAFREDMSVWSGPSSVVFPRRYHSLVQLRTQTTGGGKKEGKGDNNVYYGSQSQGWMYGDGLARVGAVSWMDVTSPPVNAKRRKSDSSTTATATTQQKQPSGFLIDDVSIIDKALHTSGLSRSSLTPRAYTCLLEQARRYTLELLADAQDYALHAQRDSIGALLPSDLLLAAEMRGDNEGVSSTLPRVEDVQFMAEEVNRVPLPAIPRDCYGGVVLPPVEEQLTARTFDVVNGARVVQKMMRGGDYPLVLGEVVGGLGKKSGSKKGGGSYGAAVGRQIVVNLKSGKGGGDEKGKSEGGAVGGGSAALKASSGSKGQKRKLTEL